MKVDALQSPVSGLRSPVAGDKPAGVDFGKVLRETLTGLKFSSHAEERLSRRGIELTHGELERLKGAVARVEAKGGRDSLILIDDKAFVVSVKNKTVITALSGSSIREGVFTKIDSAIVS